MKHKLIFAWILTMTFSYTAMGQATADYDKSVDFSAYKTYSFAGWQENSDQILNQLDKERIQKAFVSEFAQRGMTYQESGADAIVTLFITTQDKSNTTAYTNYTGAMGYRGGWGYAGGWGGSATTSYSTSEYTEGTLIIDMYDTSSKNLLWQGILKSTVKENPQKREKSIPKNVSKLMKKFPVDPVK